MNNDNLKNSFSNTQPKEKQLKFDDPDEILPFPRANTTTSSSLGIKPRRLKVIEIGDFWAKRTRPSIHLQGKWMLQAGIFPNRHVEITNPSPGVLIIQLTEDDLANL